jgi:hypothetical protein
VIQLLRLIISRKILVLVLAIAGLGILAAGQAQASHTVPCTNAYGQLAGGHPQTGSAFSSWDDANFHYQVFVFGVFANDAGRKGDRIDSAHCDNPVDRSISPERVVIDHPNNDLRWLSPSGTRIYPIEARLGVPRFPGAAPTGNNDGAWMNRPPSGVVPTDRPPVYQFAQYRAAGLMDDAGMARINAQKIWCIGMGSSPELATPAERANCQDALTFNPSHGAGYTFVEDNCVSGVDTDGAPLNCADGNNFNWYRFWYGSLDYTGIIGQRGGGGLNDFDLHMESLQLVDGTGFGTYMFVTFKYPKPVADAACAGISAPGSVRTGDSFSATVSMRNRGGLMWTFGNYWLNDYFSTSWGVTRVDLPPPGLFNPGETAAFNFNANAPNAPGTYPFNWRMHNASGGFGDICYGQITVYQPYDYQPFLSQTPPFPVQVTPGTALNFESRVYNAYPTFAGPAATIQSYYYTYAPNSGVPSGVTPYVGWGTPGIAALTSKNDNFSFTIPAGAPDGTRYCFFTGVNPAKGNHPFAPDIPSRFSAKPGSGSAPGGDWDDFSNTNGTANDLCYEVENPRYPYLTTTKGDIHAGGSMGFAVSCPNPVGPAPSITGRTSGATGSVSEYVLSAGQNLPDNSYISSFGSKLDASGAELTFGNQPGRGKYGTICRPPIIDAANAYTPKVSLTLPAYGVPLFNLTPFNSLVEVTPTGPGLILAGGAPAIKGTLYVKGDVYIASNIATPGGSYPRSALPSFGLVVDGDIYIHPNVTQLYGFYFASGSIDTCRFNFTEPNPLGPNISAAPPGGQATLCGNPLVVRGLMMAESFKFRRTGSPAVSSGLTPSEEVNFGGEVFLAPPPAFIDYISPRATKLDFQGERPPLR